MKVEVNVTESFKKAARPLIKRYRSFVDDLAVLETELLAQPKLGSSLGGNIYKVRMRIASKGKGKSGGARVISLLHHRERKAAGAGMLTVVNLLTVYDKSDQVSVSDAELKRLVMDLQDGSVK